MNIKYFINLAVKNPKAFAETLLRSQMFTRIIKDSWILKMQYYLRFKKFPNLQKPTTFNEKLLYLTLQDRKPIYNVMVDKFEAKEFIKKILKEGGIRNGEEFIIPTYGVYEKFDDINFSKLPNSFVIKTTHDSGSVIIVRDKGEIDIPNIRKKIEKSLQYNYYWFSREWVYKDVKPRIIIEKLLVAEDSSNDLKDYKFFCFNGKPKFIKVDYDRFTNHHANYYNLNWDLFTWGEELCPPDLLKIIDPPQSFSMMLRICEIISPFAPFLRVDFYENNGYPYVGELTLYPAGGLGKFTDDNIDLFLGNLLNID